MSSINENICIFCYKNFIQAEFSSDKSVPEITNGFLKFLERFIGETTPGKSSESSLASAFKQFNKNSDLSCCSKCVHIFKSFCDLYHEWKCIELNLRCRLDSLVEGVTLGNRIPARVIRLRGVCKKAETRGKVRGGDQGSAGQLFKAVIDFRRDLTDKCMTVIKAKANPGVRLHRDAVDIRIPGGCHFSSHVNKNLVNMKSFPLDTPDDFPTSNENSHLKMDIFSATNFNHDHDSDEEVSKRQRRGLRRAYACPKCQKTFSGLDAFESHKKFHEDRKADVSLDSDISEPENNDPDFIAEDDDDDAFENDEAEKEPSGKNKDCGESRKKVALVAERPKLILTCNFDQQCTATFHSLGKLRSHRKTIHGVKDECPLCGKVFPRRKPLDKHLLNVHKHELPISCTEPSCPSRFALEEDLQSHIDRMHNPHRKNDKLRHCPYPECGKILQSSFTLQRHLNTHDEKYVEIQRAKGREMSRRFWRTRNKNQASPTSMYSKRYGNSKPIICDECGKILKNKEVLRVHKMRHSGPDSYRFSCHQCGIFFFTKPSRDRHMIKHTQEKAYQCSICGQRFGYTGTLKRHMKNKHKEDLVMSSKTPAPTVSTPT